MFEALFLVTPFETTYVCKIINEYTNTGWFKWFDTCSP